MTCLKPSLIRTVRATIRRHTLFSPGQKVIVAVSGGIDSMVLLDLLHSLDDYRLELVVAHLNHLLRGDESDADEAFVRETARRLGLPCVVERVDVRALSRSEQRSLEDAGREARHRFLADLVRREGAHVAALAHHGDDQAETVLMRLLRGSGATGLAGMSPRSGWKVRPLLQATRQEIADYAAARHVIHREDGSNTDQSFLRNRIRHELLPLLATYNPHISRTLGATAAILAADDEVLDQRAEQRFSLLAQVGEGEVRFPVVELFHEPDAIRFRLYRRAILMLHDDLLAISYRHLTAVDRLLRLDSPSGSVMLPHALRAGRVYDRLRFFRSKAVPQAEVVRIEGFGSYSVAGGTLVVSSAMPPLGAELSTSKALFFDLAEAPFPWSVRTFREGDRMVPFGMTGSKKLKEIFIDLKIPRHLRRELPVLCDGGGRILAVPGVRRSALAPVSERSRDVAGVSFRRT